MYQKLMLTAGLLALEEGNAVRSIVCVILIFTFSMVTATFQPFNSTTAYYMTVLGSSQMFLTILCAVILQLAVTMEAEPRALVETLIAVINIILLVMNVALLIAAWSQVR